MCCWSLWVGRWVGGPIHIPAAEFSVACAHHRRPNEKALGGSHEGLAFGWRQEVFD